MPLSLFISSSHLKPTWHVWADSQTPPQWIYYSATHKGHFFPLPQITSNTQWGHHIIMTYITQYSPNFFSITSHDTLGHKKGKRYFFKKFEWILYHTIRWVVLFLYMKKLSTTLTTDMLTLLDTIDKVCFKSFWETIKCKSLIWPLSIISQWHLVLGYKGKSSITDRLKKCHLIYQETYVNQMWCNSDTSEHFYYCQKTDGC